MIRGFRQAGAEVDRHFFRLRCDDQVTCWQALARGVGVGFAPHYLAREEPALVRLAGDILIGGMPMWLVTHRELRTSARIRAVFDFLAERLSALDLS